MKLLDYIPTGAENALPAKELCKRAGFPSVRTMQQEIHRLRKQGHLICSGTENPAGYFIATNKHEAARFIRSMESRRREIAKAINAAKQYSASILDGDGR